MLITNIHMLLLLIITGVSRQLVLIWFNVATGIHQRRFQLTILTWVSGLYAILTILIFAVRK